MDAYKSEIIAVIAEASCDDLDAMVAKLKQHGVEVSVVNASEGVIEGLVDAHRVKEIDELEGIEYVRTVFTYAANYPPGDPRDTDGR